MPREDDQDDSKKEFDQLFSQMYKEETGNDYLEMPLRLTKKTINFDLLSQGSKKSK